MPVTRTHRLELIVGVALMLLHMDFFYMLRLNMAVSRMCLVVMLMVMMAASVTGVKTLQQMFQIVFEICNKRKEICYLLIQRASFRAQSHFVTRNVQLSKIRLLELV